MVQSNVEESKPETGKTCFRLAGPDLGLEQGRQISNLPSLLRDSYGLVGVLGVPAATALGSWRKFFTKSVPLPRTVLYA
jgi:hypothetical protein